jgi:hypothetical protein
LANASPVMVTTGSVGASVSASIDIPSGYRRVVPAGTPGILAAMSVADTLKFLARSGWRVLVAVVGATITLAGLVMIVTPGPGLVLVVLGLGILASEFAWARRLRDRAVDTAKQSARKLRGSEQPAAHAESSGEGNQD